MDLDTGDNKKSVKILIEELKRCEAKVEVKQTELARLKENLLLLNIEMESWTEVGGLKTEELKKSEHFLTEVQASIWERRNKFCDEVDEFLNEYGVLSPWWQNQMDDINSKNRHQTEQIQNNLAKEMEKTDDEILKIEQTISSLEPQLQKAEKEILDIEEKILDLQIFKEKSMKNTVPEINHIQAAINSAVERNNALKKEIEEREAVMSESKYFCEETIDAQFQFEKSKYFNFPSSHEVFVTSSNPPAMHNNQFVEKMDISDGKCSKSEQNFKINEGKSSGKCFVPKTSVRNILASFNIEATAQEIVKPNSNHFSNIFKQNQGQFK